MRKNRRFVFAGLLLGFFIQAGGNVKDLASSIPDKILGWKSSGKDMIYGRDKLFDYMDGGAEVYLAFDFREVFVRKYADAAGNEIALDIYDMGSSREAFGIFSFDRQDPEAGIGQDSEYGLGLLKFRQGRYFVSITVSGDEKAAEKAVLELGKAVAPKLGPPGEPPDLLKCLPPAGLKKNRISYFHDAVHLSNRYFVSAENILNLVFRHGMRSRRVRGRPRRVRGAPGRPLSRRSPGRGRRAFLSEGLSSRGGCLRNGPDGNQEVGHGPGQRRFPDHRLRISFQRISRTRCCPRSDFPNHEVPMKATLTRRDFMRGTTAAVLGATVALAQEPAAAAKKTRVVLIRHPEALNANSQFNEPVIQQMLDEAVMKLLDAARSDRGVPEAGEARGRRRHQEQRLVLPPHAAPKSKRPSSAASSTPASRKRISASTTTPSGRTRSSSSPPRSSTPGPCGRTTWPACRAASRTTSCSTSPSRSITPTTAPTWASLFLLPQVKGKTRLNVLCVLTPQYYGRGPHNFNRRYVWNYKGLIVGQDPVAVDTIGLRLLMAKRRKELGPAQELPPVPKHIQLADTKYGIGTSDMAKIELVKLGWVEDILI